MMTVALPKGKLAFETLDLFSFMCGSTFRFTDRKLVLDAGGFRFLLVRSQDVPTYVYHGAADLGVVGLDVLSESRKDLVELLDLNLGRCSVVVGSRCDKPINYLKPRIKIATKMPNITYRYFSARAIPVEVIKLYGSIELAPLVDLADGIVDIVQTGDTMKQNNLRVENVIMNSSAFLVCNKNSFFEKKREVLDLQNSLKIAVDGNKSRKGELEA